MGNYEQLKQAVSSVIKNNGNMEITGDILQNTLLSIISTVGGNATFAGIATPTTNPGTPDQNVFYIASENGTYSNFGGVTLENQVVIFSNANGSWKMIDTRIASDTKLNNISLDAYPYVLSSKTTYIDNAYIEIDNTIKYGNKLYRIRQIQVKQNDIIFIRGKFTGRALSGLYSSEIPSNENLLEQYISPSGYGETEININKKAISDGYLLITEYKSTPLLVVVNPVFAVSEIRKLIQSISIYKTINNSYLFPNGSGMSSVANNNYVIDLYDVSDSIDSYIQIFGGVVGYINIWGFVDNEEINEENTILKGDNWSENTKITPYENLIIVPKGAKYLCITRYKGDNITIKAEILTTSFIEKQIEAIQEEFEKVNKSIGISDNIAWTLKTKVDEMLSSQYPNHNIPLLSRLNNRYNFGDVKITENITIPNISESVIINVDKNPDVNDGYSSTKKMFNIDDKICIGTKDIYDLYLIKNITELSFECELLECNTNLIGEILQKETSYTNSVSSKTAIDYVHVYKYNDILSYKSNELPQSVSFDGVHPNVDGRSINSFIIADVISSLYGKPTKIYSFGDSWTVETQGWVEVGTILNCQMVNKGVSGDRIEHIIIRFLEFMESYSESEGDVFLFVMGTNNLLDITRNGNDKNKQLYNSSYISIFKEACETISEKLPKGNWFIANGHKNSESIF